MLEKERIKLKKTVHIFFLVLFFSALFLLRFIHLGSDPPRGLDPVSPGFICDPGNYASNARNKIIMGEWKIDDWSLNYMYVTPIPHFITYLVFSFFGVGIAQMNAVPALFSCLILILIYFILKKTLNSSFALLGVLLLGLNYHFTMFSRISNGIMAMLFFACLAIYFLTIAESRKYTLYFMAGFCCFLSFTAKGTFLLILPAVILGILATRYFQGGKSLKMALLSLVYLALGMTVGFALWLWLFYLPNQKLFQDLGRDNTNRLVPGSLRWAFHNFWTRPLYHLSSVPVLTVLVSLFMLVLAYWALKNQRRLSLHTWISGFWIISNYAYLSFAFYKPLRHEMPLILPASLLAAVALREFSRAKPIQKPEKMPFLFYPFFFFWAIFFISDLIILSSPPIGWKSIRPQNLRLLVIAVASTVLLGLLMRLLPHRLKISLPVFVKAALIGGFVLVYAFFNLKLYWSWACSPRYDIKHLSQDLGKAYTKMSIAGLSAPLVVMENQHIGHGFDYYIDVRKDFLQKYEVTHLIIIPYFGEIRKYQRYYPETMKKARLVARYPLWKTHFELWELTAAPQTKGENEDLFEGEIFFGRCGFPRFDPEASGKYAFVAERNREELLRLPRLDCSPGPYEVTFFLKANDVSSGSDALARISVVDSRTQSILASRKIFGKDFSAPGRYLSFSLPLVLKEPTAIGLELASGGKSSLLFDKVTIRSSAERSP